MRWTAAAAAVLIASFWAVARAQTTTSPLARDGGLPPALEDGGTAVRPFEAGPDGGATATFSRSPIPVQRRNGVDYVGSPGLTAAPDDGGTARAENDRGPQGSPAETEELKRRVAALEQRVAATSDQERQLARLNDQISELREEIAQLESRRETLQQDQQQQVAQSHAQTQEAVTTLQAVQQALANGNGDVAGTLSSLASSLPPAAQRELSAAQESLGMSDLYGARNHVAAAIAASQR
jgi:hypothetical protein